MLHRVWYKTLGDEKPTIITDEGATRIAEQFFLEDCDTDINRYKLQWSNGLPSLVADTDLASRKLTAAKIDAWERIKAERDSRINGGVNVSGYWFHSDGYSRIQHLGLKDEIKDTTGADTDPISIDNENLMWKTMSGAFVPLTRKMVLDIVKAVKVLDERLFKAAEVHRTAMEASADPEAYDFSNGWPARYGDAV